MDFSLHLPPKWTLIWHLVIYKYLYCTFGQYLQIFRTMSSVHFSVTLWMHQRISRNWPYVVVKRIATGKVALAGRLHYLVQVCTGVVLKKNIKCHLTTARNQKSPNVILSSYCCLRPWIVCAPDHIPRTSWFLANKENNVLKDGIGV